VAAADPHVLDPDHLPTPFTAADLTGGLAIVVGAESRGLSDAWSRAADAEVRIPMFGAVNSLNVAASAALIVYEMLRQRGADRTQR